MNDTWTEDRVALLLELRPSTTAIEISERLGLSKDSVKSKCQRLGLQFNPWSQEKEALLLNNWDGMNTRQLAALLGFSTNSVLSKAKRMGLHKPNTGWSPEHDTVLREMWPDHYAIDIATRLGRTKNAVIGRAHRLGLKSKHGEGWGSGVTTTQERIAANAERRKKRALVKTQKALVKAQTPPKKQQRISYETLPEVVADPLLLSIMDLKTEHCRWPYGEAGSIKYCGHQSLNMQSYCGAHYRMSYQPPRR